MNIKRWISGAVVAAVLAPSMAFAQNVQNGNPPAGETTNEWRGPNRMLLGTGAITFGVPYLASVTVAGATDSHENNLLAIPGVGPWLTLVDRTCTDTDPCHAKALTGGLLIVDGVLQGIGLLGIGASFLVPEQKMTVPTVHVGSAQVQIAPSKMGKGGYGLAAVGEF